MLLSTSTSTKAAHFVGQTVDIPLFNNPMLFFLSVRLLSVLCGHSFFFIPATTANDLRLRRIFYPRFYPLHLFSYLNSWERASIFPFECSVLNKGTTGTIFVTSLVWRGPWLGIEPGTSRTRSQHYTTRLARRQFKPIERELVNLSWLIQHLEQ